MAAKAIILFASALFVKSIAAQCIGAMNSLAGTALAAEEFALAGAYGPNLVGAPLAYPGIANYGLAANSFVPTSGGGFAVTSSSPISPTGINVISENAIEGALAINGELPFLGAVAVEGSLPSAGAGGISYGCGSGAVGIVSEGIAPGVGPAYAQMAPVTAAPARLGYGPGPVGPGMAVSGLAGMAAPGLAGGLGVPGLGGSAFGRRY